MTRFEVTPHASSDGDTLAARLAADVTLGIERHLRRQPKAAIVVPGGRTPGAFLRALARQPLDWSRIRVTLADERCVPLDDPASNLRMVQQAFAGSGAAASLLGCDATGTDAAVRWQAALGDIPTPFAAVVLGMGEDGHFASLFPHMTGLAAALDPDAPRAVVRGLAPVQPHERLSLNLSWLLETDLLALLLEGPDKLRTLQQASGPGSALEMPVRALLRQGRAPLQVYHAR